MGRSAALASVLVAFLLISRPVCGQPKIRVVHVFVALADNVHQGIVPVSGALGNGDAPATNLYWGAAYGVKSFFRRSADWRLVSAGSGPAPDILERCVFRYRDESVYVVADAYRGSNIRDAVTDFLRAAAGLDSGSVTAKSAGTEVIVPTGGAADLIAYVGHDAFMDFQITPIQGGKSSRARSVIILACASKAFFEPYLKYTGATPLLWTTELMAPEAYTLKAALDGWIAGEDGSAVRMRAAEAYDHYQHCGGRAAQKMFVTGW